MPLPSDDGVDRNQASSSKVKHVIVCGLGPLGAAVLRALASFGATVIGVGQDPDNQEVPLTISTVDGEPTSETVLRRALIERALALISTVEGDAANALICLTARALNPNIRLIVRGESPHSMRILEGIGADAVVCPEIEAGRALARAVLDEREVETVEGGE